jgi:hypothetical protein
MRRPAIIEKMTYKTLLDVALLTEPNRTFAGVSEKLRGAY